MNAQEGKADGAMTQESPIAGPGAETESQETAKAETDIEAIALFLGLDAKSADAGRAGEDAAAADIDAGELMPSTESI